MSSTFVTIDTSPASVLTAEANIYYLLSKAFSHPDCFEPVFPEGLSQSLNAFENSIQEAGRKLSCLWGTVLTHDQSESLLLAYSRLFIGPFAVLASPYASLYLDSEKRIMGEVSMAVAECYADAGLAPGEGPLEAPDHIALELEFLYYLTHQALETGNTDFLERRKHFIKQHLQQWIPDFTEAIQTANQHPFYNALADFTRVYLTAV